MQKIGGDALQRLGIRQAKVRDLPIFLHAKHISIPEILRNRNIWIDATLPHHFVRTMQALRIKPDKFVRV